MKRLRACISIVWVLAAGAAAPAWAYNDCPSGMFTRGTEQLYCCADNAKMRVICISQCCAVDHMASAGCGKHGGVGNMSDCPNDGRISSVQFSDPTFSAGGGRRDRVE